MMIDSKECRKTLASGLIVCLLISGCVRLKGNTVFEYVPSLPKGTVPAKIAIEEFSDLRPESDRKHTRDVEPVAQKVTRKIYDDFRDSQLFEKILSGSTAEEVDLIVKGRIYSFYWKNRYEWYVFVPYISLIILFGVPAGKMMGEAKIALDLVSRKSGKIIATYEAQARKEDTYTGYRTFWGMVAGNETSESFRVVVDQLKDRILADKDRILQSIAQA